MAEATVVVEFAVMKFKPESTIEQEGTDAHKTWQELLDSMGKVPGVMKQFSGRQLEDPSMVLHLLFWATETAPAAFATSPLYESFIKGLKSLGDTAGLEMVRLTSPEADLLAALNAPCTEVFTAHGAEPAYPAAVGAFADKVAAQPPEGYRGGAVLDSVDEVQGLGRVVKLVVGWDSREVHLAAKGKPGPISDNIQLLREGKKAGSMYHVKLTAH